MGHMDVTFDYLPEFERRAKALAKKYKSFPNDYQALLDSLENNPFQGSALGANVFKIRMSIESKGRGKSGDARVLTYTIRQENETVAITLMTIYDKSEISNVSDTYIKSLVQEANNKM